jgi:hypothetical protein
MGSKAYAVHWGQGSVADSAESDAVHWGQGSVADSAESDAVHWGQGSVADSAESGDPGDEDETDFRQKDFKLSEKGGELCRD